MPKRDKKESKTKKKRKGLSNKELIKLLKQLKPKTQQIVRVNVGDQEKKKKKGDVQSSYNPPFVFPSQGYPAIINLGQAPPPVAPIQQPQSMVQIQPLPESQQPQLQEWVRKEPLLLTDVETDIENVKIKRKSKKREEEMRQGYSVSEPRFNKPRTTRNSQLAAQSALSSRITELPSMNDPYIPVEIQTNKDADQVGNVSSAISSDEWVLSPDGNVISVEEMQQQKMVQQSPEIQPPIPPVEEIFGETIEENLPPLPPPPTDILPTKEEISKAKQIKTSYLKPKKNQIINDLNVAISSGLLNKDELPAEWFNKKGGAVGKLKESITLSALQPYWEDVYVKKAGQGIGTSNI
jgi:hypothetical protein